MDRETPPRSGPPVEPENSGPNPPTPPPVSAAVGPPSGGPPSGGPPSGGPTPLPSRVAFLRRRFPSRSTLGLYMAAMGPGLISALAGNDAGGIGTCAYAGAKYGYRMLFLLLAVTFVLALVQEMAARMGAVTQKGLSELIREQYGVSWTLFALLVMFVANTATVVAEFAGVTAAGELFNISKYVSVPLSALIMYLVVTRGPFRIIERIFLAISLVQFAYVVAAIKAVSQQPDGQRWGHVLAQTVVPRPEMSFPFLLLCVGVVGTTVAPWMQFFLQSNMVDKGIRISEYRYQKADVYLGAIVTDVVSWFIIVCTATTLYKAGSNTTLESTSDIARALSIPLGQAGTILFAGGLLAASLLAAAVLPLATAYTWCEAFGWEIGLEKSTKQAPFFYGIFGITLFVGAAVVLLPFSPLAAMLVSQDLNGMLLPVVLIFMLKLVNDRRVMHDYVNGFWSNVLAWSVVTALIMLTMILLITSALGLG